MNDLNLQNSIDVALNNMFNTGNVNVLDKLNPNRGKISITDIIFWFVVLTFVCGLLSYLYYNSLDDTDNER